MKTLPLITLLFAMFAIFAPAVFAASAPSWVRDKEKDYPSATFVSAVGEGATEKKARAAAVAAISQFFDTKTEVLTVAAKSFQSVQVAGSYKTAGSQSLEQITKVASEADFFGLQYTQSWYNEKRDTYHVLAYINKLDAAKTYKGYIATLMDGIKGYRTAAQSDAEPLNSALYLQKAESLSVLALQYIKTLGILEPNTADAYKADIAVLNALPIEHTQAKKQATFSVCLKQDDKRLAQLADVVASLLEQRGYVYAEKDGRYTLLLDVTCNELTYEVGPFVAASLKASVTNSKGDALCSYSKKYARAGAKDMDAAYARAVYKIQEDLRENFFAE